MYCRCDDKPRLKQRNQQAATDSLTFCPGSESSMPSCKAAAAAAWACCRSCSCWSCCCCCCTSWKALYTCAMAAGPSGATRPLQVADTTTEQDEDEHDGADSV